MRALLAALAILATACGGAGGAGVARRLYKRPAPIIPPASAPFDVGTAPAVLSSAVRVLVGEGFEIAACDATRVATRTAELDLPCGAGSCLTRESVTIRVGYRVAKVELSREIWDPAAREWDHDPSPLAVEDAVRREERLLSRILTARTETGSPPPVAECDKCPPSDRGDSASN